MSKSTPGPWEVIPQNWAGPMIAHPYETGKQMNPRGLRLICHVLARGNSIREDDANARLIAAAPALLAACKLAIGAFENNNAIDWSVLSDAIDLAAPADGDATHG